MSQKQLLDIEGRTIERGDLILIPKNSSLAKGYVLGFSSSGTLIVSCYKTEHKTWRYQQGENKEIFSKMVDYRGWKNLSLHNDKQYLTFAGDLLILQKNASIPENLKQFLK